MLQSSLKLLKEPLIEISKENGQIILLNFYNKLENIVSLCFIEKIISLHFSYFLVL